MPALARARFQRLPNPGATSGGPALDVQFNPTDYTLTKDNQLAEVAIPGLDSPIIQFVRGQTEKLTLDLFFDSTEDGTGDSGKPVTEKTDRFYELVKIDPDTHAPPVLLFTWGGTAFPGTDRKGLKCVVAGVRQQFTFFSPSGVPLRAKLTVDLREYKTLGEQLRQLKLRSADHTKADVVRAGDTITGVAFRAYGDPTEWRRIAAANGVEDPLALTPGAILRIPRGDR
jgi:Contractile injection system tube protein/LysM domain